jgi:hypothetical protein
MKFNSSLTVFASMLSATTPAFAGDAKLTEQDRLELLRGLTAEYATVKAYLPRSKKPLPFYSKGTFDKAQWEQMGREMGPAARVGDQVQITRISIETDRIILEINHGLKAGRGSWRDHVSVGVGGMGGTQPVNQQGGTNAPGGTYIALIFYEHVPAIKASEVKTILAPVLDFDQHSATENYMDRLPEPVKTAIKSNKVIEGMSRDEVLLAMGKPRHKERGLDDGAETEDWVYGFPPGKITFITFTGSKVSKVKEAYADIGGSTAMPNPPR